MNDDEVAFRIVRLYFEEIARLGFKRQLDLDQIINAYFYVLKKLNNKDELLEKALKKMSDEEKKNVSENTVTTKTTTTVTKTNNAPTEQKEKSITEILEEK
ncbi:MAG: hypothetical protein PHP82_02280 [Candidatus ainarchaeum sp.]|nr:hypothetical protein [Candidatus ainarchaeum sp.]